jgi:hypothetical protein
VLGALLQSIPIAVSVFFIWVVHHKPSRHKRSAAERNQGAGKETMNTDNITKLTDRELLMNLADELKLVLAKVGDVFQRAVNRDYPDVYADAEAALSAPWTHPRNPGPDNRPTVNTRAACAD